LKIKLIGIFSRILIGERRELSLVREIVSYMYFETTWE
jgi:hypothetical protein